MAAPLHSKTVWLVNQYALRLYEPGITRHSMIMSAMRPLGWRAVIFTSASHYWNLTDGSRTRTPIESETEPEGTYVRLPTPTTVVNGGRRVLSMIWFSLRCVYYATLRKRLKLPTPDVVVGSSPHPFGALAAFVISRRYRVPFVLEVRDLWPDSLIEILGIRSKHPIIKVLRVVERFLYSRATLIIAVLPQIDRHIKTMVGVPPRIVYIPNGVSISSLPAAVAAPVRDNFIVMYAGAHGVPNAIPTLLEAARLIELNEHYLPLGRRTQFILVGEGKQKSELVVRAERMGLSNVEFRQAVPKPEIPALLSTADVLTLTWLNKPLYRFGVSPNKLFDYFAAERPVVMALSAAVDPVTDANAGYTVPAEDPQALANALLRMRALPVAERAKMGANGRRFVETNHDIAKLGCRYAEALDSATNRR